MGGLWLPMINPIEGDYHGSVLFEKLLGKGEQVKVFGLKKHPDRNGQTGTVKDWFTSKGVIYCRIEFKDGKIGGFQEKFLQQPTTSKADTKQRGVPLTSDPEENGNKLRRR